MECRALVSPRPVIPDPQHNPAAHGATLGSLYACAGISLLMGLLLKCGKRIRPYSWEQDENGDFDDRIWDMDELHVHFYILSTLGYGAAGLATQLLPGDMNWAIQISKVVIILAWTCLLKSGCGAVEAMCPEKGLKKALWLLGLVLVLASLVEVVIPGERHFQGFMWGLAAQGLVCAFTWFVVWTYDKPKKGERRECGPSAVFRIEFYILAAAGHAVLAIAEPHCGYAGHATCYANCYLRGSPGGHFPFSLITFIALYLALAVCQIFHPYPYVFPDIPFCRSCMGRRESETEVEDVGPTPAAEQVPPSASNDDDAC